jgi:lycopene cyclase CruP
LQVGDASGIQSPLSFGGFGALTRHLARLNSAITGAVQVHVFTKNLML